MIEAGRSSGRSAKYRSRCRLSACTVRCNVVFTYHSGTSSTSIFFAAAARTLRVADRTWGVGPQVVGEPVAQMLISGDRTLLDVERDVEVCDRGVDELVEQDVAISGQHRAPAFA